MDDRLAERIRLFRAGGRVRPEVADFVTAELRALADEGRAVTETTAGVLTSHLMLALTRLLDGEPITDDPADALLTAELGGRPDALERARAVARRAERALGAALPESEVRFLGMHLAVLTAQPAP
ncbi:PRD domain-containing protein [Streptomyces clavuligerus]|uniref:PRD domain-containing protein n=1 Tax=Streptomyces clavuligerus TaxID=1901 RepID=E2Q192_STRCL|nr:PRD domain-containing protein [Streptomyces clavuligerus]ANW18731.1 transcriptional antiterminator [Streptomyces clavuligerus]AXU13297.1 PRD domain-containing protein [Streptomyces clavuligerus]EFG08597.1 PRD domain-containing protein [Streptomyces clavuligerus]MBY6303249.1 PRD domain-containing protein [Streptomyces clavuligerus]QCS06081.1 PRD domain-containing protein [Streptomyces clavuligerus]